MSTIDTVDTENHILYSLMPTNCKYCSTDNYCVMLDNCQSASTVSRPSAGSTDIIAILMSTVSILSGIFKGYAPDPWQTTLVQPQKLSCGRWKLAILGVKNGAGNMLGRENGSPSSYSSLNANSVLCPLR